jgi:hypothetical protein
VDTYSHEFNSVYVFESLPPGDRRTGTNLFEQVLKPLELRGVVSASRLFTPSTLDEFLEELDTVAESVRTGSLAPIIHFEMHGNARGLELATGEFLVWERLRESLTKINTYSGFNLFVSLAACSGAFLISLLLPTAPSPVWGLLGPTDSVSAVDVENSFRAFYDTLLGSCDADRAVAALNSGRGSEMPKYDFVHCEPLFCKVFLRYLRVSCSPEALHERVPRLALEAVAVKSLSPVDALPEAVRIREYLENRGRQYEDMRAIFLMFRQFPRNRERFTLTLSECERIALQIGEAAA